MNTKFYSLLIPFFSGISTTIGFLPIFISKKYQNILIPFSLSFSAGVMIFLSCFSLIPEAFLCLKTGDFLHQILLTIISILIGFFLSSYIDMKIETKIKTNSLYKLGILSIIVLILHNIPEGITTYLTTEANYSLGISLAFAIALHNIPEGIAIAIPIYYSTKDKKKAFNYTFISGFSEFLGAIFAYLFFKKYINKLLLFYLFSTTAGIMLHLSFIDLLPNSFQYKKKKTSLLGFALGSLIMILCLSILH